MDTAAVRSLVGQLGEDLDWLEQHSRSHPDQAQAAGAIRMAASLVRNCLGPALDEQTAAPLHLVVVGGAGAGKSTVSNMLSGATAAEANPQAGFTRHPIAYTSATGPINWTNHLGFLGPLQRLAQPSPSSLDQDVYQVRRVPNDPTTFDLLKDFVVWDCPDMTTWAASGYIPRLLEVSGLADVLVYVASDERYNDEVPTQFLRLLLQTGKPVIVCLLKMHEADAPALIAHFQKEVLGHMPRGVVATLAIPHLTPQQLADPARQAPRWRVPLINQVAVLGAPAEAARRRTVLGAVGFLRRHQDQVLAVAHRDLQALNTWQALVQNGRIEFEGRYVREYLTSEKFRGFDDALVRLLQLLELPGVGKILSGVLGLIRLPFRFLGSLVSKAVNRPDPAGRPELPVLEDAFNGWIDQLRKEAARQAGTHALWAHINQGFTNGALAEHARAQFQEHFRKFHAGVLEEADRTARAIYEKLEQSPGMLNTLRSTKLALDVAAVGGAVWTAGLLYGLILSPLIVWLTQQLVELLGTQYVDAQRELTRQRQQQLLTETVALPLAGWLAQWPSTGGSSFERLQRALRRLPGNLEQLCNLAQAKLAGTPKSEPRNANTEAPAAIPVA
jgi:hypothetical protein